jgi:hypothetical protein
MLRTARTLAASLALFALVAAPSAAQDSVAGAWVMSMTEPSMGTIEVHVNLEQDGEAVTGSISMPAMPEIEGIRMTDGEYIDGVLFFLMHAAVQGQVMTVEVEADVDGDEMVGEVYVPEMGQAVPFTGKRNAGF